MRLLYGFASKCSQSERFVIDGRFWFIIRSRDIAYGVYGISRTIMLNFEMLGELEEVGKG